MTDAIGKKQSSTEEDSDCEAPLFEDKIESQTQYNKTTQEDALNKLTEYWCATSLQDIQEKATKSSNIYKWISFSRKAFPKSIQNAVLFLNLRIGYEPPDVFKFENCARFECWTDPNVALVNMIGRGTEIIMEALEAQYSSLGGGIKYFRASEVSVENAKKKLASVRRTANVGHRMLIHYNGHGVPKPTQYGEVWFSGKGHYYPLDIVEKSKVPGSPTIFVLDCNGAAAVLEWFISKNSTRAGDDSKLGMWDDIFFCSCGFQEILPLNPCFPADLFTACLTTPLRVAIEWYINYSNHSLLLPWISNNLIRSIPGGLDNIITPLGELQAVLASILDQLLWISVSHEEYCAICKDEVLAALYRNFFLADKVMGELGCNPVVYPSVTKQLRSHELWDVWELTIEGVLYQLQNSLLRRDETCPRYTFFSDQLMAFEHGINERCVKQLPVVLRCIRDLPHLRMRALQSIAKYFLCCGVEAVVTALLAGAAKIMVSVFDYDFSYLPLCILIWLHIGNVDPEMTGEQLCEACAELQLIKIIKIASSDEMKPTTSGRTTHYLICVSCYLLCCLINKAQNYKTIANVWNLLFCDSMLMKILLNSKGDKVRMWVIYILSSIVSRIPQIKHIMIKIFFVKAQFYRAFIYSGNNNIRACGFSLLSAISSTSNFGNESQLDNFGYQTKIAELLVRCLNDSSFNVKKEILCTAYQLANTNASHVITSDDLQEVSIKSHQIITAICEKNKNFNTSLSKLVDYNIEEDIFNYFLKIDSCDTENTFIIATENKNNCDGTSHITNVVEVGLSILIDSTTSSDQRVSDLAKRMISCLLDGKSIASSRWLSEGNILVEKKDEIRLILHRQLIVSN